MQQKYCIKQECLRKAQGAFLLAHKMGLLEDPSMQGLEARRQNHNEKLKMMEHLFFFLMPAVKLFHPSDFTSFNYLVLFIFRSSSLSSFAFVSLLLLCYRSSTVLLLN